MLGRSNRCEESGAAKSGHHHGADYAEGRAAATGSFLKVKIRCCRLIMAWHGPQASCSQTNARPKLIIKKKKQGLKRFSVCLLLPLGISFLSLLENPATLLGLERS